MQSLLLSTPILHITVIQYLTFIGNTTQCVYNHYAACSAHGCGTLQCVLAAFKWHSHGRAVYGKHGRSLSLSLPRYAFFLASSLQYLFQTKLHYQCSHHICIYLFSRCFCPKLLAAVHTYATFHHHVHVFVTYVLTGTMPLVFVTLCPTSGVILCH